jgi:hypothetical protein
LRTGFSIRRADARRLNGGMTNSLQDAFAAASPRITPRRMPVVSLAIYLAVLALWAVLFGRSLWLSSIWAWSAGMVYIGYDTVLMLYVVWQTLPLARGDGAPASSLSDRSATHSGDRDRRA